MEELILYTWVDVQDRIESYFSEYPEALSEGTSFRAYWDELHITIDSHDRETKINDILETIFLSRYHSSQTGGEIVLESKRSLPVVIEIVERDEIGKLMVVPTTNRRTEIKKYDTESLKKLKNFANCEIVAFHSFKGGVGRTLHAIAFALEASKSRRVLLVDADFEAPGITWLQSGRISFADVMALVHAEGESDELLERIAENIRLEVNSSNLVVLPAFRNIEKRHHSLDIKPENLMQFTENPFRLSEIMDKIAAKLGIDLVVLDLRAGVSELSSTWFIDPRVRKVFVTTLSSQSVLGTALMFRTLKAFYRQILVEFGEFIDAEKIGLIISQIPRESLENFINNWSEPQLHPQVLQQLRVAFIDAFINLDKYDQYISDFNLTEEQAALEIVSKQTMFTVEYESLKTLPDSLDEVLTSISTAGLDKRIQKIISAVLPIQESVTPNTDEALQKLEAKTMELIYAESSTVSDFMITEPIRKLVQNSSIVLPSAVFVGMKGAGKTFLFRQLNLAKNWNNFVKKVKVSETNVHADFISVTFPSNLTDKDKRQFTTIPSTEKPTISIFIEYIKPDIEISLRKDLTKNDWRIKWMDYIAWCAGCNIGKANAHVDLTSILLNEGKRLIVLFDGLEELFPNFNTNTAEQQALYALIQDIPEWLGSQLDRRIGFICFIRQDIVSAAIKQNVNQFLSKYKDYQLKWLPEDALRLILWVLYNAKILISDFGNADWQSEFGKYTFEELGRKLEFLWGKKMAAENSKEAFSHNWVLSSLANLNKEFQSRDIIRLLHEACKGTIENATARSKWIDRILVPSALREAIVKVGEEKINEIKSENIVLKNIFEKLENRINDLRFPCTEKELLHRKQLSKMDLESLNLNGVLRQYQGEYYMAEIFRKGMGFEYSKKGRPKVLYL